MAAPISYLQVENLTKSYGDRVLFADITFGVNEGDKIGLIAKNGTGKTTLLRIIAGREDHDDGKITFRNDIRVGYLEQQPTFDGGMTAAGVAAELDAAHRDLFVRYLTQLGVNDDSTPLEKLSGGQRKRVAMARVLAAEPNLLILDEPTNHLDLDSVEWLENFLRRSRMTLLMVTHDRYFLDRVCNKIIEIDRQDIFTYDGNFDYYLRRREERIAAMSAELARVKNTLRKEQDWMNRQPQARAGKAQYRIDQFYDLKERSRVRLDENSLSLKNADTYIGNKIFEAENVSKRFGDKVILDDFTYTFARYEKVGIIGANGVGKSTFIKMLMGLVPQDSGHWNVGETVRFGYYSQDGIHFNPGDKVIDAVTRIAEDIEFEGQRIAPMQFLQKFLFTVPDQQKYISTLSGGELCRLHLATVLMRQPNFLVLDEPTNDLDIVTLGVLEEYLSNFRGCVIVISHDRFFLDNIVDHLFVMTGNGNVKDFPGNYSDYRQYLDEQRAAAAPQKTVAKQDTRVKMPSKPKLSFKERRELESLTAEIELLTAEKQALEAAFQSGDTADIAAKSQRYEEVKDLLDEKELRWLELSEIEG
jgi:ATP-binding cassette subfamily F protein uup